MDDITMKIKIEDAAKLRYRAKQRYDEAVIYCEYLEALRDYIERPNTLTSARVASITEKYENLQPIKDL